MAQTTRAHLADSHKPVQTRVQLSISVQQSLVIKGSVWVKLACSSGCISAAILWASLGKSHDGRFPFTSKISGIKWQTTRRLKILQKGSKVDVSVVFLYQTIVFVKSNLISCHTKKKSKLFLTLGKAVNLKMTMKEKDQSQKRKWRLPKDWMNHFHTSLFFFCFVLVNKKNPECKHLSSQLPEL